MAQFLVTLGSVLALYVTADTIFAPQERYYLRGSVASAVAKDSATLTANSMLPESFPLTIADYYMDAFEMDDLLDADDDFEYEFSYGYGYALDDYSFDDDHATWPCDSNTVMNWTVHVKDSSITAALDHISLLLQALWVDVSLIYQAAADTATATMVPLLPSLAAATTDASAVEAPPVTVITTVKPITSTPAEN